ncbi:MAG: oligoendopeptidase F [Pseudomonadota bacterium]
MILRSRSLASALVAAFLFVLAGCSGDKNGDGGERSAQSTSEKSAETGNPDEWDLTDLYSTQDDWASAREAVNQKIETLEALRDGFGESGAAMASAMDTIFLTLKELYQIYAYASLGADEDIRDADGEARRQEAQKTYNDFSSATSWLNPEILTIGEERVAGLLNKEKRLDKHRFYIENVLRRAPHTLDAASEKLLAATSPATEAPNNIYTILANADLPWPEITLSDGEALTLDKAAYSRFRQSANRADRKLVFDQFWGAWKGFENTMGAVLGGHLKGLRLQTEQRKFETSAERALFDDAMPTAVYETLITEVNASLPTLHRYFALRKRMLGIEDAMGYHDIYPPLVALDKEFSIETSIEITREALAPLGAPYLDAYDKGVSGRWMHIYPQTGKRSGAYMQGAAYDVHPYVLLNHNDDYESASTFAHEFGHAVHSVLANDAQPFETADYATFIAETASIMNEMLLQDLVVARAETPQEKLYYLGFALESLRGTYFRQAMFSEFEYRANALADAGEPITGAKLTEIYLDLLKRYHGHEKGVMEIDDLYGIEWAYIPHFYYDFYVFQYATSIAAASSLAEKISSGDTQARDRFITMLKAGGSDHPYTLMKNAGVDLATPDAHRALVRRAEAIMDEIETILVEIEATAEETSEGEETEADSAESDAETAENEEATEASATDGDN